MRRAFVWFISVTLLGLSASAVFGQYPYPYPPMQGSYPSPYGYSAPMPAYVPNPMMARPMPMPMPYPPMPMPMYPNAAPPPKVMVYGPLDRRMEPAMLPVPSKRDFAVATSAPMPSEDSFRLAQGDVKNLPVMSKQEMPQESCGPDEGFGAVCDPRCWQKPMRGKGHFIGEVGAYFLVPYATTRLAYTTTVNGESTVTDFPNFLAAGPRASWGYLCHTGWGVRANYGYLTGVVGQSAVVNPGANFKISSAFSTINSPTPSLESGIGFDNFDFRQRMQSHMVDLEFVKEASFLDTTFLFGVGGRYARINQSYTASRVNTGGPGAGLVSVALDREDLDSSSLFHGWGPTVSLEVVQPLSCGISAYGSVRGSFLFGNDRFSQNYHGQRRSTDETGVSSFVDTSASVDLYDHRYVSFIEPEAGLQFGRRIGRCYVYGRMGAVFQRWWDVGTATTFGGSLNMVGGTLRLGIVY